MPINERCRHKSPQVVGEAGFTLIEMIIVMVLTSILGTFTFQITTNSLKTLRDMRNRKERSDDAVMALGRISKEVREAESIDTFGSNTLIFVKNVATGTDTNVAVKFIRNTGTNRLRRQSAADVPSLPGNSTSGNIVAENVTVFTSSVVSGKVVITLEFSGGSEWQTTIYPRNYGL